MRFLQILRLYRNRLKRIDNVAEKNRLEADFYNRWADDCLKTLDRQDLIENESGYSPFRYVYFHLVIGDVRGKRILNLCCGDGRGSTIFAKQGGLIYNVDIAWNMMKLARMRAEANGVSDTNRYILTSAEQMGIRDCQFDLVISLGALHHLQPKLGAQEIARVLKPGGKAIFLEPLLNSRLLLFVRSLFPTECHESPGGGGMTYSDIREVSRHFGEAHCREFLLTQRLLRLWPLSHFWRLLAKLDLLLLEVLPFLRDYAGAAVIVLQKARDTSPPRRRHSEKDRVPRKPR